PPLTSIIMETMTVGQLGQEMVIVQKVPDLWTSLLMLNAHRALALLANSRQWADLMLDQVRDLV
ncbi:hypothetical protein NPIL_635671, partial [Nephila pilipes]